MASLQKGYGPEWVSLQVRHVTQLNWTPQCSVGSISVACWEAEGTAGTIASQTVWDPKAYVLNGREAAALTGCNQIQEHLDAKPEHVHGTLCASPLLLPNCVAASPDIHHSSLCSSQKPGNVFRDTKKQPCLGTWQSSHDFNELRVQDPGMILSI